MIRPARGAVAGRAVHSNMVLMTTRQTMEFDAVNGWIGRHARPALISHVRPDGDAIGSLAAMSLSLARRGLSPSPVLFDAFPERYAALRDSVRWLAWEDVRDVLPRECDCVIVLDTCSLSQLEPAMKFLASAPETLVIDHHATRDALATRPGDLRCFDESASATCLIVAEWLQYVGAQLDAPLAQALLTGIGTDCGWFRHSNTDVRTLEAAARLAAAGADLNALYRSIYERESVQKLRLVARLLGSIELLADGKLAVMRLRQADFDATGADRSMTEDLVNEGGRLAGVEMTLLLTEEDDGRIRANLRSKQHCDVSVFAARYGGGGHTRAAGARLHGAWDRVVPRLIDEAVEFVHGWT